MYGPGPEHFPSEGDGYMIFTSARDLAHGNFKRGIAKNTVGNESYELVVYIESRINLCEPGSLWSNTAQDWIGRKPICKKELCIEGVGAKCEAGRYRL